MRERDLIRFYEINPHVIHVANEYFSFVPDCRGKCEVLLGDARLTLEEELADGRLQQFDVLVLDAFSGDAIPTHLLTREAFEVYDRHLSGDGAICVHISNQYLDLSGVVRRLAEAFDYGVVYVNNPEEGREARGVYSSDWMVLSRNRELIRAIDKHVVDDSEAEIEETPLWTDDWTDLWRILK
jgi:spermidine synthase